MYTLNGRIKFEISLTDDEVALFEEQRLREIVLNRPCDNFRLSFYFSPNEQPQNSRTDNFVGALPDYVNVILPETILSAQR